MKQAVLGLIGAGNLAKNQHLPNLMWTPHARLKTVCDLREQAVREAQAQFRVPHGETDYRKLLADPEIEGVVIATRAEQHAELAIAALRAGKHVYVEKPLAESVAQCQAIVAEQEKSGKHVAVGFNRRFAPAYRKARELLRANGGAQNIYYRISDTYCYTWGKNYPPGQRVFHELCHIFDLLRWLTGSEIDSVYTVESRPDDEIITLKFKSGPVATILSSGWSTLDWPKEYLEALAAKGGLTVDSFVELRTYGLPGAERCYRFRGHFHPRSEWTQRYLYEALGSEALRAICALEPDRFAVECGRGLPENATAEDRIHHEYLAHRLAGAGYSVDKGWIHALDHFGSCIADGATPETAGARDGLIGELLANAVVESRKTKAPVRMKDE